MLSNYSKEDLAKQLEEADKLGIPRRVAILVQDAYGGSRVNATTYTQVTPQAKTSPGSWGGDGGYLLDFDSTKPEAGELVVLELVGRPPTWAPPWTPTEWVWRVVEDDE